MTAPARDLVVCIDGASRGNPGRAAIGVVVLDGAAPLREIGEAIGVATNNFAEYQAFLRGLREAEALGGRTVRVQSDSELLVRQLTGEYKVRSEALTPLHREALARMRRFDRVVITHVPREENAAADALANRALDAEAHPAPTPGGRVEKARRGKPAARRGARETRRGKRSASSAKSARRPSG